MNYKKMDGDAVRAKLAEGRLHLKFVCRLYKRQIKKGKFFLHEHPASALSWSEDSIKRLCELPSTFTVTADQCQYGLVTPSAKDKGVLVPALKPTRCLTNSEIMSHQLCRRCKRDHEHQPLVGGRCSDAAMYPVPLVRAILRGIELQHKEGKMMSSSRVCAMPMSYKTGKVESFGPQTHSSIPNVNGGTTPITYDQSNVKDRYLDEYTGQLLAPNLIRAAIEDELNYFNSKVWQLSNQ